MPGGMAPEAEFVEFDWLAELFPQPANASIPVTIAVTTPNLNIFMALSFHFKRLSADRHVPHRNFFVFRPSPWLRFPSSVLAECVPPDKFAKEPHFSSRF